MTAGPPCMTQVQNGTRPCKNAAAPGHSAPPTQTLHLHTNRLISRCARSLARRVSRPSNASNAGYIIDLHHDILSFMIGLVSQPAVVATCRSWAAARRCSKRRRTPSRRPMPSRRMSSWRITRACRCTPATPRHPATTAPGASPTRPTSRWAVPACPPCFLASLVGSMHSSWSCTWLQSRPCCAELARPVACPAASRACWWQLLVRAGYFASA